MITKTPHRKKQEASASQRWRERHPDRHELANIRSKAKAYGCDPDIVADYWKTHNGLCDICGRPERTGKRTRLSIEHDHVTGQFRGLVCSRCNTMIGMAEDNEDTLLAAVSYLKRSRFDHE